MEITSKAEYFYKDFSSMLTSLFFCGTTSNTCGPWADSQWESSICTTVTTERAK